MGSRTVCHKRHSYRLLIFAVSSPQPSWTAVKYIQRKEDRGRDRAREHTTHPCQTESSLLFLKERRRREEGYLHLTCPLTCSLCPYLPSHLRPDREVQLCHKPSARLSVTLQKAHPQILTFFLKKRHAVSLLGRFIKPEQCDYGYDNSETLKIAK